MTDLGPALAIAILVAAAFAGCVGSGSTPSGDVVPENASDGDGGAPGAGGSQGATSSALAFDTPPANATRWNNGTFDAQEAYVPFGLAQYVATGEIPGRAVIDITEHVPPGLPVRVQAEATYDSEATGIMFFALDGDGFETHAFDTEGEGSPDASTSEATATLDSTLVREDGGTVQVRLSYSTPDPSPSVDYTFRVDVEADPAVATGNAPVAFPVDDPADPITLRPVVDGQTTGVTVWDADDETVALLQVSEPTEVPLPDDAPAGEYVLLAHDHPGVAVEVPGGGTLRALSTETTYTQGTSAPATAEAATGSLSWSFNVSTVPVAVGIGIRTGSNGDDVVFSRAAGTVSSPDGGVFSFESFGTYVTDEETWTSDPGGSALVPGTYQAEFSSDAAANVEVGQVVVEYVR